MDVTTGEVLGRLEIDSSLISETTVQLNLGHIRTFITSATGEIEGIVNGAGLSIDSLSTQGARSARLAITMRAVAECYGKLGQRGRSKYTDAVAAADRAVETIHSSGSFTQRSAQRTNTNADAPNGRRFSGRDYEF